MAEFSTGLSASKIRSDPFGHLSLDERKALCLEVLNEVGAQNITEKGRYELYHSCVLPWGNHPNGDRNPSASVNYAKMVAGCYVCGNGGWLWWISAVKGFEQSFQARDWVANRAGESRTDTIDDLLKFLDSLYEPHQDYAPPTPVYDPSVLNQYMLIHPYMTEIRQVPMDTMVRMKVGYGTFSVRLGDNNFVQSQRIMIPHFFDGKLLGWQTRRLGDDGTPKYLSTPDMPKDSTMFDFDRHRGGSEVVVVESPMTVLRHAHHGPLTATFGASLTTKQMDMLVGLGSRVILWLDNDTAGWNATEKVGDYLMERITVWAVQNPIKGDPADLSDAQFAQVLEHCVVPYALWSRPTGSDLLPKEASDEEVRKRIGVA